MPATTNTANPLPEPPNRTPMVDPKTGMLTELWQRYLRAQWLAITALQSGEKPPNV